MFPKSVPHCIERCSTVIVNLSDHFKTLDDKGFCRCRFCDFCSCSAYFFSFLFFLFSLCHNLLEWILLVTNLSPSELRVASSLNPRQFSSLHPQLTSFGISSPQHSSLLVPSMLANSMLVFSQSPNPAWSRSLYHQYVSVCGIQCNK